MGPGDGRLDRASFCPQCGQLPPAGCQSTTPSAGRRLEPPRQGDSQHWGRLTTSNLEGACLDGERSGSPVLALPGRRHAGSQRCRDSRPPSSGPARGLWHAPPRAARCRAAGALGAGTVSSLLQWLPPCRGQGASTSRPGWGGRAMARPAPGGGPLCLRKD